MSSKHIDIDDCASLREMDISFGPKQRTLLEEITHILTEYPDGSNILKEIIQNADDANASSISFLLDPTQHPATNLALPDLSGHQGPALYSWNDSTFSSQDWDGIQRIGRSVKEKSVLKVGRFGLGFVSVYHLTDCPTILSEELLGINFPERELAYPGNRGVSFHLHQLSSNPAFSGHHSCFHGYFGYAGQPRYEGTIFRFPLRREKSAISEGVYDASSLREKLLLPLTREAEHTLLFLKSITSIRIEERLEGADRTLFRAEIPRAYQDNVRKYREGITEFVSSEEYRTRTRLFVCLFPTVSCSEGGEETGRVWLLLNLLGFRSPHSSISLFHQHHHLDFLPWVGLALPTGVRDLATCGHWCFEWDEDNPSLIFDAINTAFMKPFIVDPDTQLDISTGRIFCFLPTQLESKFPFHIHGYFSLSSNRRSVPWPAQDNLSEIGARWNQLLAENLLSLSYALLLHISVRSLAHPAPRSYHYQLMSRWSSHDSELSLFATILRQGLSILSRHLKLFSEMDGGTWLLIDRALFLPSLVGECLLHENVCRELLELLDQPIVAVPPCISEIILSIPEIRSQIGERLVTPVHVREALVSSNSAACREFLATRDNTTDLLDTLISYNEDVESTRRFLEGVPLLPTAVSSSPQLFQSTGGTVYYISVDTETHIKILPGLEGVFIDPSIPASLHSALLSLAGDATSFNLYDATNLDTNPTLFSQLLTRSLSCFFHIEPDTPVTWRPTQDGHPPVSWLLQLFQFISHAPDLLTSVSHLPILPQHIISSEEVPLLPLRSRAVYVETSASSSFRWIELKLQSSGCLLLERNSFIECFSEFVLPCIPGGLIPVLRSEQVLSNFVQALETPPIEPDLMFQLMELLIPIASSANASIIAQLPMFPNTIGGWIKLDPDTILPPLNIPTHIPYPPHFVSTLKPSVRILYEKLGMPTISTEGFIASHLLPYMLTQEAANVRNELTLFVLDNVKRLNFDVCDVGTCLKTTEWILDASTSSELDGKIKLCTPTSLFDPRDDLLRTLILPQTELAFPNALCEDYLDVMKKLLGLNSHDSLSLQLLTRVCNCSVETLQCSGEGWMDTFQCLIGLLHNYINKFDSNSWNNLLKIFETRFISVDHPQPEDWPIGITFCSTDQLCYPGEIVLCNPGDVYLIGSVFSTLASTALVDNPTTLRVLQGMGMLEITSEMVVQHINLLSQLEINNLDGDRIYRMVSKVYSYLNNNIEQVKDLESDIIFIPEESKFVPSNQIVFKTPIDLRPYMHSLQQLRYEFTQLFNFLNIGQSPSCAQLSSILTRINDDYQDKLSQSQLRLVINILRYVAEQSSMSTELQVLIPGKDLRLYQPNHPKLVFWDHRWLDRNLIEEDFVLVHDEITNDLAYRLGVSPFSEKVAPPSEDFWCEESGQQVSVTDRLHAILDGYHGDINVLKEMLQNADDAGATEMRVVFDWRSHPTNSLLTTALRDWQGPAILFYNDATFSERDFENIMKIDGATKAADATTIGRFGLGFCTVYHLTDVPSFVSRNYIHILDPHKLYISKSKGGRKIDFCNGKYVKFIHLYRDQFSPYAGVFGCDVFNHKPFNGTLFRLPFRPYNISSKVSLRAFDHSDISQLQENFVKEAESLIFFTQCVKSVGIYSITDVTGEINPIHTASRTEICHPVSTQPFLHAYRGLMNQLADGKPVEPAVSCCEYKLSVTNRPDTNWVITYATGSSACAEVLKKFPRALAPLPFAGVALNLEKLVNPIEPNFSSTLYCFLPLPIHTNLPFHCHAMFELRRDRQGLVDTVEAKTEWNKVLVSDPLALATSALYSHLADKVKSSNDEEARNKYVNVLYYMFSKDSLTNPLWKGFAEAISKRIAESDYPFFPRTTETGVDWGNFRSTNFLNFPSIRSDLREFYSHSYYSTMQEVLVRSGRPVAVITDSISEENGLLSSLFASAADNIIHLNKFSLIFFANISKFGVGIILDVLKVLISVCSAHPWLRELILSTECIPCGESGVLQPPGRVVDPSSQLVARLFETRENRLPNDMCRNELFSDTQVLNNLTGYLGLITTKLPADDLKCRAEYVSGNSNSGIAIRLIEYLNQKIFTGCEIEEMRSLLRSIAFIPVECPQIEGTFSYTTKFCAPSEIVASHLKPVAEFQLPVYPEGFLAYQDFISHLRLSECNLSTDITLIAVSELELCIRHYDTLVQAIDLLSKVTRIYETIGEHGPDSCRAVPKNGILIPSVGFYDVSRLLLASSEDFPPYIYSLSCYNSRGSRYLREFFLSMGVSESLSHSQCQIVMEELHSRSVEYPLAPDEQRIAIKFILHIHQCTAGRDNCFLLGMDGKVHSARDCVFHDLNWDRRDYSDGYFTLRDRQYYFVHSHVSNEIASSMGASPLSHVKLSGRTSLPFRYQSEGQVEPLTTRLRNILSEYESDVDVFKELTQNADDACATEIKFLFDSSHYGEESVIHPGMKHWQGPAIYCYNNATFSDEDFKNITKLAARSKMEDRTTIGTYGIGFNTVYHLTDLPSFVSRRFLTFFDPHVSYLEGLIRQDSPGMQIDFVDEWENLRDFQDQFSVYNGIFGCNLNNIPYNGTLFRLPLRTCNVKSKISSKYYVPQTSLRDLHSELSNIAKHLILFLQTIQSIEIFERTALDQNMTLTLRATKHSPQSNFLSAHKPRFDEMLAGDSCDPVTEVSTVRITALCPPESEGQCEEFVLSYSSGAQLSFNLVERIKSSNGVCTLPVCGVAVPKVLLTLPADRFAAVHCYLFCYLPLPALSALPMHVNGSFQLQQSRRALHCSADGSVRTEWNRTLINDALSTAVVNLLLSLTECFHTDSTAELTDSQLERYLSFWPESNQADILWREFPVMVARRIIDSNSRVLYCSKHPKEWVTFEEASVFLTDPSIYTLDREFTDILFEFAASEQIYFINIPNKFKQHAVVVYILNSFNESKLYSIARACSEILFRHLNSLMLYYSETVKLILSNILRVLKFEPCLMEILTTEPCIPCGEEACLFRPIPEVVSPFSIFARVFYPEDKRVPNSFFCDLFDKENSPDTFQVLVSLGVILLELPLNLLLDRCHKTRDLELELAHEHSSHLLDYINSLRPGNEAKVEICGLLLDIPFIPVYQDVVYNCISPEDKCAFSCPSRCCVFDRKHLSPRYKAVTREANSLLHAMALLGIADNQVPLESVLESIFTIQNNLENLIEIENIEITRVIKAIYTYLADGCYSREIGTDPFREENRNAVLAALAGKHWILHESCRRFYPVSQTVLTTEYRHFNSQFLNCFSFTQLLFETNFQQFVVLLQIPDSVTPVMAIEIICKLREFYVDEPLPSTKGCNESGFVIQLINSVFKNADITNYRNKICLLTEGSRLQLASVLYQNDTPWINYSDEVTQTLVHHDITLYASHRLGAMSKRDTYYDIELFPVEEFGQYQPISNRIDNLLREFPCDVTIFKELIQNAEDAGATEVAFVLDLQRYGEQSLCLSARYQQRWKELQRTPSLLVYNNRAFTEKDLQGIQAVGIGGKEGKNTIGRFGLGFNSVFHLTRSPTLLTSSEDACSSNFCVFDPYREHLSLPKGSLPGIKLRLDAPNLKSFEHQFEPYFLVPVLRDYNALMNQLRERQSYSVFRLPLNVQREGLVYISENLQRTRGLLLDLIREAPRLFTFIRHIRRISVFEIKSDGSTVRHGIVDSEITSHMNFEVSRPICNDGKLIQIFTKKVTICKPLLPHQDPKLFAFEPERVEWLIYHFNGDINSLYANSKMLQSNVSIYGKEKLRLFSSIAIEIPSSQFPEPTQKKYLFCHLPFGNSLDFPVHINCPFILDPHRRYVSYQDETTGKSSWDSIWHSEIIRLVLSPLYFQLLIDLGPGGKRYSDLKESEYFNWYYSLFPVIHQTDHGSNSMEFLQSLGRHVLRLFYQDNSSVLLADNLSTWYPVHGPDAGVFRKKQKSFTGECASLLVLLHYHLTCAPLTLAKSFESCKKDSGVLKCKYVTPLDVLDYINKNRNKLAKGTFKFPCSLESCVLTFCQLNIVLEFILEHYSMANAKEQMHYIPLKVDYYCNLGLFDHCSNSTFTSKYALLLPHLSELFLCEKYTEGLVKSLKEYGYVEDLNVRFVANKLRVPERPSPEFFLLFWSFILEKDRGLSNFFPLFGQYLLAPVRYSKENHQPPTFLPINYLKIIATQDIDTQMSDILYSLECPFLYTSPFDLMNPPKNTVHISFIDNLLKSMAITSNDPNRILKCAALGKNPNAQLSAEEAEILRNLFPNINCKELNRNHWQTLASIRMFVAHCGPNEFNLVSLSGSKVCFVSENFPLFNFLIEKLLQAFNLIVLSSKAEHHNPVKLIRNICMNAEICLVEIEMFVNSYILNSKVLPQLDVNIQKELIQFFFNNFDEKGEWVNILASLKFIKTPQGLFKASQLYCSTVPLFCIYKKDLLLPKCWNTPNSIYEIIKSLGLNLKVSLEIIRDSARDIANGKNNEDGDLPNLSISALIEYIHSHYQETPQENGLLDQLATISFLPLFTVRTLIRTEEDSGRDWRLGRFSDAQLHSHYDHCCTTSPLFDPILYFNDTGDRFDRVVARLRLKTKPDIQSVKAHLEKLMDYFRILSEENIKIYLEKLFFGTYKYLQDCPDQLLEFKNADCILHQCKLYRPGNIVMKWKSSLYPYLFQCPPDLAPYEQFLHKLGVSDAPNYLHFKSALISMREKNGSDQLKPPHEDMQDLLRILATNAFAFLIEELHSVKEGVELEGMVLLTDKHEFIPYDCPDLFYADDTQLLNWVTEVCPHRIRILAPLARNVLGSDQPPPCLNIKFLSHVYEQKFCYEGNIIIENVMALRFQTRLKSPKAYAALKRIYYHETNRKLSDIYQEGHSISDKIGRLRIIGVTRIDMTISDSRHPPGAPLNHPDNPSCICFLDKANCSIVINTSPEYRDQLPLEMAYELNQYFGNLFEGNLIHLLICLLYSGDDLDRALNKFKIKPLPPKMNQD